MENPSAVMETLSGLLLEISSDEDAGIVEARKRGFEATFLNFGGGNRDEESDDVVVIDEVRSKPAKRLKLCLRPSAKTVEDGGGDDDCVILDGNPDKSIVAVNVRVDKDSDDLAIVGEKGEVACRDFPHSRHLCAMFPFASTAHEVHCGQCHCYVCDKRAPCSLWVTGTSSVDHCHASDKEIYWKAQRRTMKKINNPGSVIPVSGSLRKTNPVPASIPPLPNSLPQTQHLRTCTVRPCSVPSQVSMPTVRQGRTHASRCSIRVCKPQPQLTSLSASPTHKTNVPSRITNQNVGSQGVLSYPLPAVIKQQGFIEVVPSSRPSSASQLPRVSSISRYQAIQSPTMNGGRGSNQLSIENPAAHSLLLNTRSSSEQRMGVGLSNYLPPQTQRLFLPRPTSIVKNPVHCQPQRISQPYLSQNCLATFPLQNKVASQTTMEVIDNLIMSPRQVLFPSNNPLPPQTVTPSRSDTCFTSGDQLHSIISPQHKPMSLHADQVSHTQETISPASSSIDAWSHFQYGNHFQNRLYSSTDFCYTFDSSENHGNLQIESEVSPHQSISQANHPQLHSTTKDDPLGKGAANSLDLQTVIQDDNSFGASEADFQFPESKGFWDFDFADLMPESHSLPGPMEVPLSPIWDGLPL